MGEKQRFIPADQTLFLWLDALLLVFLQSAVLSLSTEHPYFWYVLYLADLTAGQFSASQGG